MALRKYYQLDSQKLNKDQYQIPVDYFKIEAPFGLTENPLYKTLDTIHRNSMITKSVVSIDSLEGFIQLLYFQLFIDEVNDGLESAYIEICPFFRRMTGRCCENLFDIKIMIRYYEESTKDYFESILGKYYEYFPCLD